MTRPMEPGPRGGPLAALLEPRSIAVVGASERAPHAAALVRNLLRFGFPAERIHPVNPHYPRLFERPCYPAVGDVPEDVDLAVLAIPRRGVVPAMEECAAKGVRAALVVATGFGEFDREGRRHQADLARLVRAHDIALCGPNTLGYVALPGGAALWTSPLPEHLAAGPVSAVFTSAGLLNLFFHTAADRCLGFRYAAAPGNQVGAGFTDYFRAAVDDPGTRVIAAVIESVSRPGEMAGLLDRARERGKTVVALRLGRSRKGERAVTSHSGNMATSGAVWDGLFRQKGVIPVDNMDQMLEATALAATDPDARRFAGSGGVGMVTISGGDCSFLADVCERNGVPLPEPSDATYQALRSCFDKERFNGNPLDIEDLHVADPDKYLECLETFVKDENFAVVCCRLSLPGSPNDRLRELYRQSAAVARRNRKPVVFLSRASELLDRSWFRFFHELGAPFLTEYEKSLRAVKEVLALSQRSPAGGPDATVATAAIEAPAPAPAEVAALRRLMAGGDPSHAAVQRLLDAYGIPVAPERLVHDRDEAAAAAGDLGFPVALKVRSPDLPHKTEAGGVLLNLGSRGEAASAYDRLLRRVAGSAPHARIEGVLVQKMVEGAAEVIIGTSRTPDLGVCLAFGLGGIYTEVLQDVSFRLPRLDLQEAHRMIREIRAYPLLTGVRGGSKADVPALARAIAALSRLAADLGEEVDEIEFNPLLVLPEGRGVLAVDTLVRCARGEAGPGAARNEPPGSEE